MATYPVVEERHVVHHDDSSSSAGMAAVLIVALLVIVGFVLFAMRAVSFGADNTYDVNVDLPAVDTQAPVTPGE